MLRIKERSKELKVPHHASAAAARDGNLPQLALNNGYLPLFPTVVKANSFITVDVAAKVLNIKELDKVEGKTVNNIIKLLENKWEYN